MTQTYLREVKHIAKATYNIRVEVFEGNIELDRLYWKKTHNAEARYFKLNEVTENE